MLAIVTSASDVIVMDATEKARSCSYLAANAGPDAGTLDYLHFFSFAVVLHLTIVLVLALDVSVAVRVSCFLPTLGGD